MMNKSLIGILAVGCLLVAEVEAIEDEANDRNVSIKPCVTITGDDSRITEQSFYRIRSIDEFAEVWAKHTGQKNVPYKNWENQYDEFYNTLSLPLVDFENYMVIAIFQGSGWNNAGLKAISMSERAHGVSFRFKGKPYSTEGPDGGGKQVSVFGFFVVPRTGKPLIIEEEVLQMKHKKITQALDLKKPFDKAQLYTRDWVQRVKFSKVK